MKLEEYNEWRKKRDIQFDVWIHQLEVMRKEAVEKGKWEFVQKITEIINGLTWGTL